MTTSLVLVLMFATVCVGYLGDYVDPHMVDDRQAIVYLMGWNWTDIAKECESFLGPNGFGGVQIMPPNEHAIDMEAGKRTLNERYLPVSYKLESASGDEDELRDMVKRCNHVGVRIYADVVINHMANNEYSKIGKGSAGNVYDAATLSYPAVPYAAQDFSVYNQRCPTQSGEVEDFSDRVQVRNCNLFGYPDLDMSVHHVRITIADYMNKLIDIGVAGFFVRHAENSWPEDLRMIFGSTSLKDLSLDYFETGLRPFILQSVKAVEGFAIQPSEYFDTGRVTEFEYGRAVSGAVRGTLKAMAHLENLESNYKLMPSASAVVFVENVLSQLSTANPGEYSIDFREPGLSTVANAFMLAYPYGLTRIMSSYEFTDKNDGPPSDEEGNALPPVINEDGSCGNGWVCQHRWGRIKNLVGFQRASIGQPLANFWSNGNQQIAFSRGDKAFIVFNNEGIPLSEKLFTGLPEGEYCDVYNGEFDSKSGDCYGPTVAVDGSGMAAFELDNTDTHASAIHVKAFVSDATAGPDRVSTTVKPTSQTPTTQSPSSKSTTSSVPTSTTTTKGTNEAGSDDAPGVLTTKPTIKPTQPSTTTTKPTVKSTQVSIATAKPTTKTTTKVSTSTKGANEGDSGNAPEVVTTKPTIKPTQLSTTTAKPTVKSTQVSIATTKPTTKTTKVSTSTKGASGDAPEAVTTKPTINPTQLSTTTTTVAQPATPMNHTLIFIHKETAYGQFMFLRGGISHDRREDCTSDAHKSACAIPIRHRAHGAIGNYNAWKTGDSFLDWYGPEEGQGSYENVPAGGTPMVWTTNNPTYSSTLASNGFGYTPLNQWGEHYWMVDLEMDCSKTEAGGWFEMKGFLTNAGSSGWESDVSEAEQCTGSAGGSRPHYSTNHFAKCGYLNVFKFGLNECIIDSLNEA